MLLRLHGTLGVGLLRLALGAATLTGSSELVPSISQLLAAFAAAPGTAAASGAVSATGTAVQGLAAPGVAGTSRRASSLG